MSDRVMFAGMLTVTMAVGFAVLALVLWQPSPPTAEEILNMQALDVVEIVRAVDASSPGLGGRLDAIDWPAIERTREIVCDSEAYADWTVGDLAHLLKKQAYIEDYEVGNLVVVQVAKRDCPTRYRQLVTPNNN